MGERSHWTRRMCSRIHPKNYRQPFCQRGYSGGTFFLMSFVTHPGSNGICFSIILRGYAFSYWIRNRLQNRSGESVVALNQPAVWLFAQRLRHFSLFVRKQEFWELSNFFNTRCRKISCLQAEVWSFQILKINRYDWNDNFMSEFYTFCTSTVIYNVI